MRHNIAEILVGTAVLIIAVVFLVFGANSVGIKRGDPGYMLSASFQSAQGIRIGSDVRLAGVKVGSVHNLDLNADTFEAKVTMAIRQDINLPDDSIIIISSEGLLGGNFIEIQPGGSPFNYQSGDEVINTQDAVSLTNLLLKFATGGGNAGD